MSRFSLFMRGNKIGKENEKYAPTASLTDESGKPLEWEFRHITSKENEALRNECIKEVQVTGKPNLYRPKLNSSQYLVKMIAASTVYPDLYDAELQDSYNVRTPEDLVYAMVDDAGEYQELGVWLLGGEHNFSIGTDFRETYGMTLVVYSTDDSQVEEIKYILSVMVPVDIVTDIIYESPHKGNIYYGTFMSEADIIEIKQRQV